MTKLAERTPVLPTGEILGRSGRWSYRLHLNRYDCDIVSVYAARLVDGVKLEAFTGQGVARGLRKMRRTIRRFEREEARLP